MPLTLFSSVFIGSLFSSISNILGYCLRGSDGGGRKASFCKEFVWQYQPPLYKVYKYGSY